MYRGRNQKERDAILTLVHKMNNDKRAAYEALPDDLTDDQEEQAITEIEKKYDISDLLLKLNSLEYPQVKNTWFHGFIKSFGLCEDKRISAKQAKIFQRYAEEDHYPNYANHGAKYFCNVGNLFIKIYIFHDCGYLTIVETGH